MTGSRKTKLSPALRTGAAMWLVVWVAAFGFCSLESMVGHAESGAGHHSRQAAHHHDDATPPHEDSGHSHDSDQGDDHGNACCTSLKAVPQFANSTALTKPDFGKPLSLSFLWLAQALTLVQPEAPSLRQMREDQWVFTPEVCLGSAHRSHAPPVFA